MTDFKPEVSISELPRGFRPVRLILNNQPNLSEVIYDEPCSNFESNQIHQAQQLPSIPPPLPTSQPPISSNLNNLDGNNGPTDQEVPNAQPFWTLPSQEQEQLQQHLQEHLSRSPTPTKFGSQLNVVNTNTIEKVITDKAPPANAEFLYETDAYKFYTVPTGEKRKVMTKIKQNTQGFEPINETTFRTGANHRHGSDWYKTMFKNMHKTDQPKWTYEEPVKVRKNKKVNKEEQMIRNEYIYDNHPPINQYQNYQETGRKKKEQLEREMQKEWAYTCDEPDPKYVIKKKKTSKSKSPVSRKQYAMIQKGDDIPLSGLGKPAPKSKNKVAFYDEKQSEQVHLSRSPRPDSRSPTPVCYLTYPANDYVPERPPTPQYIYTQQQFTHELNVQNTQNTNSQSHRQIYNQPQQQKTIINKSTRKKTSDFSAIDEWQRKITDDFNQIYSTLEKNNELKRLRETGKLVSPIPPSESRKDSGSRTAKELYLDQQSPSPKPPSRKYYLDPVNNKPLSANDLFDESAYKTTTTTKYNTMNARNYYLESNNNKLNRYNSSQDLNYVNPNNSRTYTDFNNNLMVNNLNKYNNESSYKKSIHQHNSLDNLNHLSSYEQPVYDLNYKIYAQPTTTRTYTESTYIDNSNKSQPMIDLKTKTTSSFRRQNSILDIERKLNEEIGELLRSTSSFDNRTDYNLKKQTTTPIVNTIKIDNLATNSNSNFSETNWNTNLNNDSNVNLNSSYNTRLENQTRPKSPPSPPIRQHPTNFESKIEQETNQPVIEDEIRPVELKPVPFDLKPNQDLNNISFQPEEELDLEELIKKIELDAMLQDEMEN